MAYKYGATLTPAQVVRAKRAEVEGAELERMAAERLAAQREVERHRRAAELERKALVEVRRKVQAEREALRELQHKQAPTMFTDPPGTGARRLAELLREIKQHDFTPNNFNRRTA